jgi:ankyrin repeat protein
MGNTSSNQYEGTQELFNAIKENNIGLAITSLNQDKNIVNNRWKNDSTLLIEAVKINSIDLINVLIDLGADINLVDADGYSALHHSVLKNRPESYTIIKLLLEKGADPKIRTISGKLPIELLQIQGERLASQNQIIDELNKYTRYTFNEKSEPRENLIITHQLFSNVSDKIIGKDIPNTIYDVVLNSDVTILDFITENGRDGLIFLYQNNQEGISSSQFLRNINDGKFVYYECKNITGIVPNRTNVYIKPFVQIPLSIGSFYVTYDDAKMLISQHQFWEILDTSYTLNITVSENFIKTGNINGDDCQEGTNKKLYKLVPYLPKNS